MPSVESFKRDRVISVLNVVSIATWPAASSVGKSPVIDGYLSFNLKLTFIHENLDFFTMQSYLL